MPISGTRRMMMGSWGGKRLDLGGCVFYAPLWRPDMAGSTFQSKDSIGHTCTVTGATWTPTGRGFNGTSDVITAGAAASLKVQGATFTVEVWAKRLTDQLDVCLVGWDDPVGAGGFNLVMDRDQAPAGANIDLQKAKVVDQTKAYTFNTNTWYHIVAVQSFSGGAPSSVEYFINGASIGTVSNTSAYNAPAGGQVLGLGRWTTVTLDGTIGEVRIYNRGLSTSDILHNYQATKWRY